MNSLEVSKYLAFLLSSGDSGHKQPIKSITDSDGKVPSPDNNYLLSKDGNEFSGLFKNTSGQVFDFSIRRSKDTWTRTFKPSSKVKDNGVR